MSTLEPNHTTWATWVARAQAFRADDPDPETQLELDTLLRANDYEALRERFAERLAFGTAGLRGLIGAGDNRMNRRVVAQTTAGLCAYLSELWPDAKERGLCVGWDCRHKSREFADEVIAVASGAGFVVHAFETDGPTPLLAFSVLDRAAAGGVMITASHNPPLYNGYKVYLRDGAQLAEPRDAAIARASAAVESVLKLARLPPSEAIARGLLKPLTGIEVRYISALRSQLARANETPHDSSQGLGLRVAYTPLHGVGLRLVERALREAGVDEVRPVATQADPDPDFPTLQFPNPEEPGALDRLLVLATEIEADLAIANDPDADRLALAVRDDTGDFAALSGNEIGVLFADYLLGRAPADGRNLIVSTIVSTPLVGKIAAAHGARWETTLTGFKWIMRRALELQAEGARFVLGFEEALGYCIGDLVNDKDGVAGAAHAACMTGHHLARGRTLHQALDALYARYGVFDSRQIAIQFSGVAGLAALSQLMQRLRARPPEKLAGRAVVSVLDLQAGIRTRGAERTAAGLPASDVLAFELEGEQRVTIRPSGTEPKLKIYLDGLDVIGPGESLSLSRARLRSALDALGASVRERCEARA